MKGDGKQAKKRILLWGFLTNGMKFGKQYLSIVKKVEFVNESAETDTWVSKGHVHNFLILKEVCIDIHILMHLVEVERTHLFWYRFGIVLEIVFGGPFWK